MRARWDSSGTLILSQEGGPLERVRLDRIGKVYHRDPVLIDFSLAIEAGEFCVILGPSGSGKSTVMNIIGGFIPPTTGEVYIDGAPITGVAPHKRNLGVMFQGYALFPHLTVFENVAFPLKARGVDKSEFRAKVERILGIVELVGMAERLPHELSGGQQQRAALARALVFEPRLLLMDEPLAALDRRLRERMQSEIHAIQRKLEITVLYITHDQQEAMTLADKIVVMRQGRIEQIGKPLEVYGRPRTRFVSEFLGDSNLLDVTVESIDRDLALCRAEGGLDIRAKIDGPIEKGRAAIVSVRPERVRFLGPGTAAVNAFAGRIAEFSEFGAIRRCRIDLRGAKQSIFAAELTGSRRDERRIGDEVVIAFDIEDAIIVES